MEWIKDRWENIRWWDTLVFIVLIGSIIYLINNERIVNKIEQRTQPTELRRIVREEAIPGPRGESGRPGRDGSDGERGDSGRPGRDGDQGPRGGDGRRGPQGRTGLTGPIGPVGPVGPTPPPEEIVRAFCAERPDLCQRPPVPPAQPPAPTVDQIVQAVCAQLPPGLCGR